MSSEAVMRQMQTRGQQGAEVGVHTLFEARVREAPDAVALSQGGTSLTYAQLNQRANQLAHHLRELGVGPEVRVGLCAERSLDLVVGMVAILKAGGAYVPLDPSYPRERLALMLKDAAMPVVLGQRHLAGNLPDDVARVVLLDAPDAPFTRAPTGDVDGGAGPENLAYLIYTSGSTGTPKAVQSVHRGLSNLVHWHQRAFAITAADRATQVARMAFDACTWEVWPYLTAGASVHIIDDETRAAPERLRSWLLEQRITVTWHSPLIADQLISMEWPPAAPLRVLLTGSDRVPHYPPQGLGFELVNTYGPTESSVISTWAVLPRGASDAAPPIGKPIDATQVYLLDETLRPVPEGQPGELCIGGVGLARGYLNQSGLTAERFIPDPFSGVPGARLYRTGDQARLLPDGNLEFLGRIDLQVKIRGFRIELGDVEAALRRHPAVREAVVVVREDVPGDKRLAAYWMGEELSSRDARQFLGAALPEYMVPSAFMRLERFPLSPNGKIDRRALPVPPMEREVSEEYVAPRTQLESQLAEVWTELLRVERVGVQDNFLELGGHSLLSTRLMARVRAQFGVELRFEEFFREPTIAGMAERIQARLQRGEGEQPRQVFPVPRPDGKAPLSLPQEGAWLIEQLAPNMLAYQFQARIRFRGTLDVSALHRSLTEIIRRHESFRTTFVAEHGRPVQVIHPPFVPELPLVDLTGLAGAARGEELERRLQAELKVKFDTTKLPLLRWVLYRVAADEHVLLHLEHHIIHDGWSLNVFLRELKALYQAYSAGHPSPLPELELQFADFAHWQRRWFETEAAQRQLEFWKRKLAGCPVLTLPTDRARPAFQSFRGAAPRFELTTDRWEALRALSRKEGTTLFMTMMSAFLVLLHRYSGQKDFCIGSSIANRRWRETEPLIGMFVNAVVTRADLTDNPRFKDLLRRVREDALEAYAQQDVTVGKVIEALHLERSLSYNALYQVMFHFHDSEEPSMDMPGLTVDMTGGLANGSAKADLNVVCIPRYERPDGPDAPRVMRGITFIWEHNSDLFDVSTMQRMFGHYQMLLDGILARPDARVGDLPLLPSAERQRLLVDWNATQKDFPHERCPHELFEAQAARTPDAVAAVCDGKQLTYRELDQRVNRLARELLAQGVELEGVVAVLAERGLDLLTVLLAILKAGGVYLPLDPGHPPARLRQVLEQSRAKLLLGSDGFVPRLHEAVAGMATPPRVESVEALLRREHSGDAFPRRTSPGNLAYVLYTSGSTGAPKGAMVEHRGMLNHLLAKIDDVGLTAADSFAQISSQCFDISILQFISPLLVGGRTHVLGDEIASSPPRLLEAVEAHRITVVQTVPSLLRLLMDELVRGERPHALAGLRWMIPTGEALPVELARQWFERFPDKPMLNAYGSTECSDDQAHHRLDRPPTTANTPIGRGIQNLRLYILDASLVPLPIGVPGELYIGGVGVGRGYLYDPVRTAQRFIPDPFSPEPGRRLYRTGDQCRWLPDGTVEFLGRVDHQLKIRGFLVEPSEIEAVLERHPAVRQSVVVARTEGREKQLVAYAVVSPDAGATTAALRTFVRERLPEYMVPRAFVLLDTMPLTPNGKVDRKALPAPERSRAESEESFVAPRTKVEQVLSSVWCQLLRVERVSVRDSFFDLGGHSLMATQLLAQVRELFQVDLPQRSVFESPVLEDFVGQLERRVGGAQALEEIAGVVLELEQMSDEQAQALLKEVRS